RQHNRDRYRPDHDEAPFETSHCQRVTLIVSLRGGRDYLSKYLDKPIAPMFTRSVPPPARRMVTLDTTAATSNGPNESIAIDPSTISATKRAPAMGALYAAVIPAAAPQATNRRSRGGLNNVMRPSTDAAIAASCTIDPSRPIDPPETMEQSEEALRARLWPTPMRPSPMAIASM